MSAPRDSIDLTDGQASFISLLYAVAQANGSVLTVEDVSSLMSLNATADAFEMAFNANRSLSGLYTLKSGLVIQRDSPERSKEIEELASETKVRKVRSLANILYAKGFSRRIRTADVRLVSVSGSTSYFSAKKDDDIDFFCVTSSDKVWLFLARSLLMARLASLRSQNAPDLCFSCIMDDSFARAAFSKPHDALFARDALTAFVLGGSDYYAGLLGISGWMEEYFPDLFRKRIGQGGVPSSPSPRSSGTLSRVANMFLYAVVGNYVKVKSRLLNAKFARWNKASRIFDARMGPDHLMYESARYSGLRKMYSQLDSS
jgi:hypothetical protein